MAQASTMSYEVVEGWEQLPAGWEHRDVAGSPSTRRVAST